MIHTSVDTLIGHTPFLELKGVMAEYGLSARFLAKLEFMDPAGSAKDRIALAMVENAAIQIAKDPAMEGKTIVVLLPDTGERYLSTPIFR